MKMKKITLMFLSLFMLFLVACVAEDTAPELPAYDVAYDEDADYQYSSIEEYDEDIVYESSSVTEVHASFQYFTFEEALLEFPPTDVVIVEYVGHRPFGENLLEFEFIVLDRILGDAADRIFVYEERVEARVMGYERSVEFIPGDFSFTHGTEYLLPLRKINSPYSKLHEDGFTFMFNIAINLDEPASSMMYSEPLYLHAEGLEFSRNVSEQEIVSYISELTIDDPPRRTFIRSEKMEDILYESPYVFVVEIGEPVRLSHEMSNRNWRMPNDLYNVTIVQVLKGYIDVEYVETRAAAARIAAQEQDATAIGAGFVVTFFADTVFPGERHIVAGVPIEDGSAWFDFTSRNSLFGMDQLDEIVAILAQH